MLFFLFVQVRILFVRNVTARTTENDILKTFSRYVDQYTIERIKKVQDFAFVHFTTRQDAEKALRLLKCCTLDGSKLELKWARPADKIYTKNVHRGSTNSSISTDLKNRIEYLTYEKQNAKPAYSNMNNFGIIGQMTENNNYIDSYAKSAPDILEDYCKRFVIFIYFFNYYVFYHYSAFRRAKQLSHAKVTAYLVEIFFIKKLVQCPEASSSKFQWEFC